jgi:hypothetical protein
MARIEDPYHFLDLAFGYYMTGRFAAINQLNIAPNLMHHAVELLIKFTLLKDVPQSGRSAETLQLGQKYGHRLNALWHQYKQHVVPMATASRVMTASTATMIIRMVAAVCRVTVAASGLRWR